MPGRSAAPVASVVVFLGLSMLASQGTEVKLERKVAQDPAKQFGGSSPVVTEGKPEPSEQLTVEPKYVSARPVYFTVQLGSGEDTTRTIVLDESGGTGKGYDTLYVDANNNEDLTDDGKLTGKVESLGGHADGVFPATEVTLECGDGTVPCAVKLSYFSNPADDGSGPVVYLRLVTLHYCEGQVDLGPLRGKIAVLDTTCNGIFNDRFGPTPQTEGRQGLPQPGDRILIDLDGDGAYNTKPGSREMRWVARYLKIGQRFYEMSASSDGRGISLKDAAPELGGIRSAGGGFYAALQSDGGVFQVWADGSDARVPVGQHRLHAYAQQKQDAQGSLWRIEGRSGAKIEVTKDDTAELKFGAPLKIEITSADSAGPERTPGKTVAFNLSITGKGGDTYPATSITKDGVNPPQPSFEILSPSGQRVASGSFEYG